jgi:hypothetical protein
MSASPATRPLAEAALAFSPTTLQLFQGVKSDKSGFLYPAIITFR